MKPGDVKIISEKIENVFMLRQLLPAEGLDYIISQIQVLPSMPQVYLELEEEFDIQVADNDIEKLKTVRDVMQYVENR